MGTIKGILECGKVYIHTYIHAHTNTHTHSYIPWIYKCLTKAVGCGTCHKYTNIHNFYSVKCYKH